MSKSLNAINAASLLGIYIVNHLMYADDNVLLSSSVKGLKNSAKFIGMSVI